MSSLFPEALLSRTVVLLLVLMMTPVMPAIIPVPQSSVTPVPPDANFLIGGVYQLDAVLDNANILGYAPFLELYIPPCMTLVSTTSSYDSIVPMPSPTVTTFLTAGCKDDPVLSSVLPNTGGCANARKICSTVSH